MNSGYKRPNVTRVETIPQDLDFDDGVLHENVANFYDKHRHFLVKLSINMAVILSTIIAFAFGLRMWNLDIETGRSTKPSIYVLMMFGFSILCIIFMILINVFYRQILEASLSVKKSTKL